MTPRDCRGATRPPRFVRLSRDDARRVPSRSARPRRARMTTGHGSDLPFASAAGARWNLHTSHPGPHRAALRVARAAAAVLRDEGLGRRSSSSSCRGTGRNPWPHSGRNRSPWRPRRRLRAACRRTTRWSRAHSRNREAGRAQDPPRATSRSRTLTWRPPCAGSYGRCAPGSIRFDVSPPIGAGDHGHAGATDDRLAAPGLALHRDGRPRRATLRCPATTSHVAIPPATTRNRGCGSGCRKSANNARHAGARTPSLPARCAPSWSSWPRVTVSRDARPCRPILRASKR